MKAWSIKYTNNQYNNYSIITCRRDNFVHSKSKLLRSRNSFNLNVIKNTWDHFKLLFARCKNVIERKELKVDKAEVSRFKTRPTGWLFHKV